MDKSNPRNQIISCTRICVEVNLEKRLLEEIILSNGGWKKTQTPNYEKISFKWKLCHEYGHFAKNCKLSKGSSDKSQGDQWQEPKKLALKGKYHQPPPNPPS